MKDDERLGSKVPKLGEERCLAARHPLNPVPPRGQTAGCRRGVEGDETMHRCNGYSLAGTACPPTRLLSPDRELQGKSISCAKVHPGEREDLGKTQHTAEKGSEQRKKLREEMFSTKAQLWYSQLLPTATTARKTLGRITPSQTCNDQRNHRCIKEGEELSSHLSFQKPHVPILPLLGTFLPLWKTGITATHSRGSYQPQQRAGCVTRRCPGSINHFFLSTPIIITLMSSPLTG